MTTSLGCACDGKFGEEGLAGMMEGLGLVCGTGYTATYDTTGAVNGCYVPFNANLNIAPIPPPVAGVLPPTIAAGLALQAAQGAINNPPSQTVQQTMTGGPSGTISTVSTVSDNTVLDWLGLSSTPSAQMISGIPNWALVLAGGFGLYLFGDKK